MTDSLKVLSIKNVFENLDDNELNKLFDNIDNETYCRITNVLKDQYNKRGNTIYVVYRTIFSGWSGVVLPQLEEFMRQYRPKDKYPIILPHDPVNVLSIFLLKNTRMYDSFNIKKIHLEPYEEYKITTYCCSEGVSKGVFDNINICKSPTSTIAIPDRPPTFYSDICEFAQTNNLTLNTKIEEMPKAGSYRIFD